MVKHFLLLFLTSILLVHCRSKNNSSTSPDSEIVKDSVSTYIKKSLSNSGVLDTSYSSVKLLNDLRVIGEEYKTDTSIARIVYQGGIVLAARGDYTKAIGAWGIVKDKYPQSPIAPLAMFQQAITLDNNLNDDRLAKQYYLDFLKQYPTHSLAADVMKLISISGKSDEELIKEFEKNN